MVLVLLDNDLQGPPGQLFTRVLDVNTLTCIKFCIISLKQARELLDHLENVLANEPVAVNRGQYIVAYCRSATVAGYNAAAVLFFYRYADMKLYIIVCASAATAPQSKVSQTALQRRHVVPLFEGYNELSSPLEAVLQQRGDESIEPE
ncbi:hypothetical protein QVD17_39338 [Tagetes erecta]|uniref:Uncharacterized protein n=1 Tax=Tagetes erecta TaxID=13708 RepID=A0AAD8JQJ5_TARER|nr:hypothetical protein QVD17_39338 [Tagetes erecta]